MADLDVSEIVRMSEVIMVDDEGVSMACPRCTKQLRYGKAKRFIYPVAHPLHSVVIERWWCDNARCRITRMQVMYDTERN